MTRRQSLAAAVASLLVVCTGCVLRGQRYRDFITKTPLRRNDVLVLGIMGGRERWNNDRSVRRLALKLRARNDLTLHVETIENQKRPLAVKLIKAALDRNADGSLDDDERASAKIVLYGQSFGGAAVVKLARDLDREHIPVLLTVQVDSIGRGDKLIPPNVASAANLFQQNGIFIRGEPEIKAEDASRTQIIGNFRYDYADKRIDISKVSWFKKAFRVAHTRMEYDPDVWDKVERLIIGAISQAKQM